MSCGLTARIKDIVIRPNERSSAVDKTLSRFKARGAAFITAFNPYGRLRGKQVNLAAHAQLLAAVRRRQRRFVEGVREKCPSIWRHTHDGGHARSSVQAKCHSLCDARTAGRACLPELSGTTTGKNETSIVRHRTTCSRRTCQAERVDGF